MKKLFILGIICIICTISVFSQSKKEWERVQTSNSWNVYKQFIQNYPNGKYTEQAKQKIAQLKEPEVNVQKVELKKIAEVKPVEKNPVTPFVPEINQINPSTSVRKGKITLKDGKSEKFKNLTMQNGLIKYSDINGKTFERNPIEVFKITKTGNYAAYGAISTGLGALLGGLQGLSEANSMGLETSGSSGLVLGLTAGGVVVGGLIGAMFTNEKTVYKNNAAISYCPSFSTTFDNNLTPMLSLKITF